MNSSHWAGQYAKQHVEQLRHEAEGTELLRRSRSDDRPSEQDPRTTAAVPSHVRAFAFVRRVAQP